MNQNRPAARPEPEPEKPRTIPDLPEAPPPSPMDKTTFARIKAEALANIAKANNRTRTQEA
jgi:hypothetical protein